MTTTNAPTESIDFRVRRDDLRRTEVATTPLPALADGAALLAVDAFAFTANNVTYAVFGDMLRYWEFFPAPAGWGRVPVWGFATVAASRAPGVTAGDRFYGYLPMSSHLVVRPDRANAAGFTDATEHRSALPPVYNHYARTTGDPVYDPAHEDAQMILRPVFATAFLIDDFLAEEGFFDARTIVLSSASSKTAIATAFFLSERAGRSYEVVGLTSPGNAAFVTKVGHYDRVIPYDAIDTLANDQAAIFVDMAGNTKVRDAVHHRYGDRLRHSCAVGGTHWGDIAPGAPAPGIQPTFFFAPDRIVKRNQDWGSQELMTRIGAAWKRFVVPLGGWLQVRRGRGAADVERVYRASVDGRIDPAEGHVLAL